MANASYTLARGATATIVVERCEGDLQITGYEGDTVTVTSDTMPESAQDDGRLVIQGCEDDLRLEVPTGATVTIGRVEGDATAAHVAALEIEAVEGDLSMHAIGRHCRVRHVEGDLHAASVTNLSLGKVEGDARLEDVEGEFALEHVEGDLALRGSVGGFGPTKVEGDLALDVAFVPSQQYRLSVEGDAGVRLRDDADLTLAANVEGDVSGVATDGRHRVEARWGDGTARLTLTVEGDLDVRHSGRRESHAVAPTPPAAPSAPPALPIASDAPADPAPSEPAASNDPALAVLEAVARGEISPAEAEDLLTR